MHCLAKLRTRIKKIFTNNTLNWLSSSKEKKRLVLDTKQVKPKSVSIKCFFTLGVEKKKGMWRYFFKIPKKCCECIIFQTKNNQINKKRSKNLDAKLSMEKCTKYLEKNVLIIGLFFISCSRHISKKILILYSNVLRRKTCFTCKKWNAKIKSQNLTGMQKKLLKS